MDNSFSEVFVAEVEPDEFLHDLSKLAFRKLKWKNETSFTTTILHFQSVSKLTLLFPKLFWPGIVYYSFTFP